MQKERLLQSAPVVVRVQRRNLLRCLISWKKHKISPLLGTLSGPDEGQVKQDIQLVEQLSSVWTNLPDHLLETIFSLIKDGNNKDDWEHVQVAPYFEWKNK